MKNKTTDEILLKIENITFKENYDMIVAIAWGGIIPATLLNKYLNIDLNILYVNYRDVENVPKYDEPKLLRQIDFDYENKNILLVDDRAKTGKTLNMVRKMLNTSNVVKTFVVNGNADYSLYNESCFKFPWKN